MVKTLAEFKSDLKLLREDLYRTSESLDIRLVASYLDRLILSLEDLSESLEMMDVELETLCSCTECSPGEISQEQHSSCCSECESIPAAIKSKSKTKKPTKSKGSKTRTSKKKKKSR